MKKRYNHFHENPKNIKLLGGASFFNDIGSEMVTPLLPLYITALGGGGIAVGLLGGLREGLSSLLKILGGWLSDRTGKRKIFVFFGYLISTIFRFLLIVANSWQYILAFVSFERFGKARDAPRDAIIADSTKKTGHGFGLQQMMDAAGGVIGTLFVVYMFWKFTPDFKSIILIASIIGSVSLLPLMFVKEPKTRKAKKNIFKGISSLSKNLKHIIFVSTIFTLGNFGLYMFLILRAKELAGNFVAPLAMYALFSLTYAGFSIPFGKLSDKIGRKKVVMMGYALFLIVSVSFIFTNNLILFAALFGIYGIVYAITQVNQKAWVADLSSDMKGTSIGFYYFLTGIITIPAGIIAGALWNINYIVMFSYLAVIGLISIVLLNFIKEKR